MRSFTRLRHPERLAVQLEAAPQAREVLLEIGLIMAVHLAFALAVALTLSTFGIA
jgi:hypothetical protein